MYYRITQNSVSDNSVSDNSKELGIYTNRRNALMDYTKIIESMKDNKDIISVELKRCYDNDVIKQLTITYNV